MKFTNTLPLLAALPAATGSLLRGASQNFEAAVVSEAHRSLQECVANPYAGGEGDMATCCMPEEIDHSFFTHGTTEIKAMTRHAGSGTDADGAALETSYWHITFDADDGGNFANVQMNGWCVDLSRFMGSREYWFDVYSTYDDFPYDNVLDNPEKLANVNWMINNFRLGETYTVPADFDHPECLDPGSAVTLTWQTMQNAVWRTVDRGELAGTYYEQSGSNKCLLWYMVEQNELYGDNYEPSCDDPDAEMAVILIVDLDNTVNEIDRQVIIGEARLHDFEGACVPTECCEEMSVKHETFQDNNEISVTITPDGSADSSFLVSFTGDSVYGTLADLDAWSVDLDRAALSQATTVMVDTYSTYDNWYRFNVIENKDNIPKVNYLINNYPVGSSCSGAMVTADDFQYAVWQLVDPDATASSSTSTCLVGEANANGDGYEPSCVEGTDHKLAVLLLVDEEGDFKKKYTTGMIANDVVHLETVTGHVIIAEIPISAVEGACYFKECECCTPTFEFPVASPTDTRDDPTGSAPVEELFTPAPAPVRPPGDPVCLDPIEIMGSTFGERCAHKGVTLLSSSPGSGGPSPALRIDILDTFFGIVTGTDDTSVDFRIQNPFSGGGVDMYIQYEATEEGESFPFVTCDADPTVDECQFFGGDMGTVFTAACVDPRAHDATKQPYALVTAFFQETGGNLFEFETTNNVPECCEPDTANTGTVVAYTFEIMCTCPGGTDAEFRH
eukprot:CAMPEP_0117044498 /NCGR_PEP_ID=MMETSP0472-20121206/30834_1 /TAXON_ID=693140 ORGANISM="Tiarina fusus, Strain LIS" /NCGR_SAMPLE_ID=MMETSP0472 /ASSEMBLY_ACC=CAM_ASM_000603 /LENGTH=730 /DNA_ID=CAMNT_0004756239 /DNA_START=50 /DNA_END=2242 /DNA_ORIENTATION=-